MTDSSVFSLIPPFVVLVLGYLTKRIFLSLGVGIFVASLISQNGNILLALKKAILIFYGNLELSSLYSFNFDFWSANNSLICLFLFTLGITITMIHSSGGAQAYERKVRSILQTKKQAESASLILSLFLFIDDYFSSLTVGSVMFSLTDRFKIPRAKLAFLVDSMAAPLAVICPISSWVAAIVGFLRDNGIREDAFSPDTKIIASPFMVYLNIVPYIFYSFLIIFFTWFIVIRRISFGYMKKHEEEAEKTGNVFYNNPPRQTYFNKKSGSSESTMADFLFPIFFLISFIILGLLVSGQWSGFAGEVSLWRALRQSSAPQGLFLGGFLALLINTCFFCFRGRIRVFQLPQQYWQGFKMMLPSTLILLLAWTLGDILRNDLHTGKYLGNLFVSTAMHNTLPLMFFVGSFVASFAIGSSWGTAAMMFPIGVEMYMSISQVTAPIAVEHLPLFYPILGAILSGCVAGDHISPISDTTIMTATSTVMVHEEHVQTQMTYALPIIFSTGVGYLVCVYTVDLGAWCVFLSLFSSVLFGLTLFHLLNTFAQKGKSNYS